MQELSVQSRQFFHEETLRVALLLGPPLVTDVVKDQHGAENVTLLVPDGRAAVFDQPLAPISGHEQHVWRQLHRYALMDYPVNRDGEGLARLRMDNAENLRHR